MPKRRRDNGSDDSESDEQHDAENEDEALRDTLQEAVNASVAAARRRGGEERARLLAEATAAAARMRMEIAAARTEVEEMKRVVEQDREALEAEKATMEEAHTFQNSTIVLSVGGHRFETSRQTLTSVSGTYLASMFSGRFPLTPNAEGAYFIDRDGAHFRHILNFLRDPVEKFKLNVNVNEGQREELKAELAYFGLLDRMLPGPYQAQERVGQSLLRGACVDGTRRALETAVAQARALVFEMGSATPFLNEEYQDLRWVITDRVVNGSPVWAAVGGKYFMYRNSQQNMIVSLEARCVEGSKYGVMYNAEKTADVAAPTALPSDKWVSFSSATLASHYASARRLGDIPTTLPENRSPWAWVPEMRITAVHGLDDSEPAMAAALRQLAALS